MKYQITPKTDIAKIKHIKTRFTTALLYSGERLLRPPNKTLTILKIIMIAQRPKIINPIKISTGAVL